MFRGEEDRGSGGRGCEDDDGNATRGRGGGRGRGSGRSQGGPPSPILTRAMLEAVEYIRSAAEAGSLRRCCIRAADGAGFEPGCEGIPSLTSGRRLLKMFADGAATPSHGQQVVEWANALETETALGKKKKEKKRKRSQAQSVQRESSAAAEGGAAGGSGGGSSSSSSSSSSSCVVDESPHRKKKAGQVGGGSSVGGGGGGRGREGGSGGRGKTRMQQEEEEAEEEEEDGDDDDDEGGEGPGQPQQQPVMGFPSKVRCLAQCMGATLPPDLSFLGQVAFLADVMGGGEALSGSLLQRLDALNEQCGGQAF